MIKVFSQLSKNSKWIPHDINHNCIPFKEYNHPIIYELDKLFKKLKVNYRNKESKLYRFIDSLKLWAKAIMTYLILSGLILLVAYVIYLICK